MKLLDAHRRKQKAAEEEARLLQYTAEQIARREAMRAERHGIAEAFAVAINRGDVQVAIGATARALPDVCHGPLGGESDRLYINIEDRTYIVNVYAHGVMSDA
jgi:hypothetical protein